MKGILVRWVINSIAIYLVAHIIKGVEINSAWSVLLAALVLGVVNALLRPILILITLPINIMTLGVFTLFINGFLFYLAAHIVQGFSVSSFWSAFFAALAFSMISIFLNLIVLVNGRFKIGMR